MFIDVISTGSNIVLLVRDRMRKAVVYFFARKNMVGIFVLYVCMLKVPYIGMDGFGCKR